MISLDTRNTLAALFPLLVAGALALTAGCSASDSGSKPGELGNGGFYFSCDDAVACSRYTNDASKFPEAVSVGSTFAVRFVPKTNSGLDIHFNESAVDRGITVNAIGDVYVSRGAKGLAAVQRASLCLYGVSQNRATNARNSNCCTRLMRESGGISNARSSSRPRRPSSLSGE